MKRKMFWFYVLIVTALACGTFAVGYACAKYGSPYFEPKEQPTTYKVTAYCPCPKCCGKWSDGVTASGHIIKAGDAFVAAPFTFVFGTILDIPNYGKVPVLDRGGTIKGNRLDVFFPTHQQALNWGVKYLEVRAGK